MSAYIVIPARLGSQRLPRKMLLAETGAPLICHTLETAVRAVQLSGGRIAGAAVATDSAEILDAVGAFIRARNLPARVEMTDPNHASGSDRVAEVARRLPVETDAIVNLQGDEPELDPQEVVRLLELLAPGPQAADLATLAYPIRTAEHFANPNAVKVVLAADGTALYFSRSPIPYDRDSVRAADEPFGYHHLGIYAYRREALFKFVGWPRGRLERLECLEQLRAMENGLRIKVGLVREAPPKGIDTLEDYRAFVARWPKG